MNLRMNRTNGIGISNDAHDTEDTHEEKFYARATPQHRIGDN